MRKAALLALLVAAACDNPKSVETSLRDAVMNQDTQQIERIARSYESNKLKDALVLALMNGKKASFAQLLSLGADPNAQINTGDSIMALAARSTDTYFLRELLRHGGDPNLEQKEMSATPLHFAARDDRLENMQLLLEAGAKIDEKNSHGETALMVAVSLNHFRAALRLIEAGASIFEEDNWGKNIEWLIERNFVSRNGPACKWLRSVVRSVERQGMSIERNADVGCQVDER